MMSTAGSPASASASSSASSPLIDTNRNISQPLPFPSQDMSRDSSSTPTQSPRTSRASRMDAGVSTSVSGNVDGSRNTGLGIGTPLPPPRPLSSPHAEVTHFQPSSHIAQIITESPSSIGSSSPGNYLALSPPLASRPPSPPLPSLPPPQRPAQAVVSRSSTGASVPGRSLSFLDPPSRSATGSVRTNNNNGHGTNTSANGSRNASRNVDHRTMSSIASSMEKAGVSIDSDARAFQIDLGYSDRMQDPRYHDSGVGMPVPVLMPDGRERDPNAVGRSRRDLGNGGGGDGGGDGGGGASGGIGFRFSKGSDSICMPHFPRTVQERLQPTIDHAMAEELKYAQKARLTGYALNIAIGLQVFLSALITGLSAVTTGRQTQIVTSILGGLGTVVASYLARARGSNEPELSIARTKDLQRFVRTCDAFVQDHGQETGFEDNEQQGGARDLRRAKELDERIRELRNELEHLLGVGDGERRLAPPV